MKDKMDLLKEYDPSLEYIEEVKETDEYGEKRTKWRFSCEIEHEGEHFKYEIGIDATDHLTYPSTFSCNGDKCRRHLDRSSNGWCTGCHGEPEDCDSYEVYRICRYPIYTFSDIESSRFKIDTLTEISRGPILDRTRENLLLSYANKLSQHRKELHYLHIMIEQAQKKIQEMEKMSMNDILEVSSLNIVQSLLSEFQDNKEMQQIHSVQLLRSSIQ